MKRNERGPTYWTTCEITACVPGEVFEFAARFGVRDDLPTASELRRELHLELRGVHPLRLGHEDAPLEQLELQP